jgi:hypothetical protein
VRGFFDAARIVGSLGLIAMTPVILAVTSVPQTGQAAVLFNPSWDVDALMVQVASSGANVVRFGGAPGLVIVEMPDEGAAALRSAGAWLVLDPVVLGGCAVGDAAGEV